MHRLAVKSSNFVDSGLDLQQKPKFGDETPPVCPKPRRLAASLSEFLLPNKCAKHSQLSSGGRSDSEILGMIASKGKDVKVSTCNGCSASCFAGSPPSRSDNPLVHDVEFIHQMELLSPLSRTKWPDRLGFTSTSPI